LVLFILSDDLPHQDLLSRTNTGAAAKILIAKQRNGDGGRGRYGRKRAFFRVFLLREEKTAPEGESH
jgi:hypothetical protein